MTQLDTVLLLCYHSKLFEQMRLFLVSLTLFSFLELFQRNSTVSLCLWGVSLIS